jgi:hypothetical protein
MVRVSLADASGGRSRHPLHTGSLPTSGQQKKEAEHGDAL